MPGCLSARAPQPPARTRPRSPHLHPAPCPPGGISSSLQRPDLHEATFGGLSPRPGGLRGFWDGTGAGRGAFVDKEGLAAGPTSTSPPCQSAACSWGGMWRGAGAAAKPSGSRRFGSQQKPSAALGRGAKRRVVPGRTNRRSAAAPALSGYSPAPGASAGTGRGFRSRLGPAAPLLRGRGDPSPPGAASAPREGRPRGVRRPRARSRGSSCPVFGAGTATSRHLPRPGVPLRPPACGCPQHLGWMQISPAGSPKSRLLPKGAQEPPSSCGVSGAEAEELPARVPPGSKPPTLGGTASVPPTQ